MDVKILASGSSGNVATIDDTLIIDCGASVPTCGDCLLITHQHTDHTKFIERAAGFPIYMTEPTANALAKTHCYTRATILSAGWWYDIGKYKVRPIELKHDVPCVGYDIKDDKGERILFATDFNSIITPIDVRDYTALYLECNNTLDVAGMQDAYFGDTLPRDEFHRRKSFANHCNADYLITLFERAGFSEQNPCQIPLTLLHKSSYYYDANPEKIKKLTAIANVRNA